MMRRGQKDYRDEEAMHIADDPGRAQREHNNMLNKRWEYFRPKGIKCFQPGITGTPPGPETTPKFPTKYSQTVTKPLVLDSLPRPNVAFDALFYMKNRHEFEPLFRSATDGHFEKEWKGALDVFVRCGSSVLDFAEIEVQIGLKAIKESDDMVNKLCVALFERARCAPRHWQLEKDLHIRKEHLRVFYAALRTVVLEVDHTFSDEIANRGGSKVLTFEQERARDLGKYRDMYKRSPWAKSGWFRDGPAGLGEDKPREEFVCTACEIKGHRNIDGHWCPASPMWGKVPNRVRQESRHNAQVNGAFREGEEYAQNVRRNHEKNETSRKVAISKKEVDDKYKKPQGWFTERDQELEKAERRRREENQKKRLEREERENGDHQAKARRKEQS